MMNTQVTVMVIGSSGVGKSQNGCGFLQKDDAFEKNSRPDSCTFKTSAKSNTINGIIRHYIDTQGFSSSDGLDTKNMEQMFNFLTNWKLGINAFFIVINVQCPKFDHEIQLMLKKINDFFNNPSFWNQTGIIFTKCYEGLFNRDINQQLYHKLVVDYIKKLPGCENINPQMPCFFVDSPKYNTEESTKAEYTKMFEFAHKNNPIATNNVQKINAEYKSKEEILLNKVQVKTNYSGSGINRVKTITYEDQKKYKIIDWNNNVSFTEPETIKSWNEYKYSRPISDSMVKSEVKETPIYRTEYSRRRYGVCGPRSSYQVLDHYDRSIINVEYIRDGIIDPDGKITYGDWRRK